jgi:hypothetical protein
MANPIHGTVGSSANWAFRGDWFDLEDQEIRNVSVRKSLQGNHVKEDTVYRREYKETRQCITSAEHLVNSGLDRILGTNLSSTFFPPSTAQPTAGLTNWYDRKLSAVEADFSPEGVATVTVLFERQDEAPTLAGTRMRQRFSSEKDL